MNFKNFNYLKAKRINIHQESQFTEVALLKTRKSLLIRSDLTTESQSLNHKNKYYKQIFILTANICFTLRKVMSVFIVKIFHFLCVSIYYFTFDLCPDVGITLSGII